MNVSPTSASSWQVTPRMMLADRETEENLWLALADQKDEDQVGLAHCLDVSYNCGPGYNQHLVKPTSQDRLARGLFYTAGAAFPVTLASMATGHEMVAVGLSFTMFGSMLAAMLIGSNKEHLPSEEAWRADTRRQIETLGGEAHELRQAAARVHQASADLRMACGTRGTKAAVDVSEHSVTLGGVRVKRKNP